MDLVEEKIVNILFKLKINKMEQKESKSSKHFKVSVLKSGIRMLGCSAFMFGDIFIGGCLFFVAECFGIIEEL